MKVYVDFTITEMAPTYRAFSWLKVGHVWHLTGRKTVSWTVRSVVTRRGSTDTSRCLVGCSL